MKTKCLATLCLITALSGCGTTLLVAGATAGGAVLYDQRSAHTMVNDLKLAPHAKKIFSKDRDLFGQSDLQFNSYNGTLLITGQVSSQALQTRISELASTIEGVQTVSNQTRITHHHEHHDAMKDTWISAKAKTKLLAQSGIPSNQFKIVTMDQVIYVLGLASPGKTKKVIQSLAKLDGVKKIVSLVDHQN